MKDPHHTHFSPNRTRFVLGPQGTYTIQKNLGNNLSSRFLIVAQMATEKML